MAAVILPSDTEEIGMRCATWRGHPSGTTAAGSAGCQAHPDVATTDSLCSPPGCAPASQARGMRAGTNAHPHSCHGASQPEFTGCGHAGSGTSSTAGSDGRSTESPFFAVCMLDPICRLSCLPSHGDLGVGPCLQVATVNCFQVTLCWIKRPQSSNPGKILGILTSF